MVSSGKKILLYEWDHQTNFSVVYLAHYTTADIFTDSNFTISTGTTILQQVLCIVGRGLAMSAAILCG